MLKRNDRRHSFGASSQVTNCTFHLPTLTTKSMLSQARRDIFILDTQNKGAKLATYTTPSSSWSSPTIANGRLYIGCNDWNLYCFSNVDNYISKPSPSSTLIIDIFHGPNMTIAFVIVVALVIVALVGAGYMVRKRRNKPAVDSAKT